MIDSRSRARSRQDLPFGRKLLNWLQPPNAGTWNAQVLPWGKQLAASGFDTLRFDAWASLQIMSAPVESQDSLLQGLLWRCKASYGLIYSGWACFMPFVVLLFEDNGLDPVQIGTLRAIGNVTSIVASPLWGMVADKAGSRVWVFLSLLVAGTILRFSLLGLHTFWPLLAAVLIAEFVASPVPSQLDAAVMAVVNRSKALSASQSSSSKKDSRTKLHAAED